MDFRRRPLNVLYFKMAGGHWTCGAIIR